VFEKFTERARQVVVLAQDEARLLKHNYIGTEHLLLGLMREEEGIAARVLESHDLTVEEIRAQVARIIGQGDELWTGQIPFTPRSKLVLELSLRQAVSLGHNYIGTEHLLLALLQEGGGVAIRIMDDLGARPDDVWASVFRALGSTDPPKRVPLKSPPPPEVLGSRVSLFASDAASDDWRDRLYDLWPPMLAGAGIFGAGLLVGWLIWG
jgi:ATP-dependent Clp protease ATP-binding subunit ClpA